MFIKGEAMTANLIFLIRFKKPRRAASLRGFLFLGLTILCEEMAMTDRQKLQRNISRALYFRFFQAFMVLVPVAVPFFQSRV